MRSGNASWTLFPGRRELREGLGARELEQNLRHSSLAAGTGWGKGERWEQGDQTGGCGARRGGAIGSEKTLSLI